MASNIVFWKTFAACSMVVTLVALATVWSNIQREQAELYFTEAVTSEQRALAKDFQRNVSPELRSIRTDGVAANLADVDIDDMTTDQMILTIHSILDNTDTICTRKLRMGNLGDGGWEICDDPEVAPTQPCIIYSFGIKKDFSFDDDAARIYGCNVYSFDPSTEFKSYERSKLVHFTKIGISGKTEVNERGWPLYTFNDIKKKMGHQKSTIDLVKMDVEQSEWPTLPEMVTSGAFDGVKQLLIEFHVAPFERHLLVDKLKAIQMVEKAGFKKFYVHKNSHCVVEPGVFPLTRTKCYEVHYVRWPANS